MFSPDFSDKLTGFADLLQYDRVVSNGVILGKGGELIAGILVRGGDQDSSTNEQLVALSMRLNALLCRFGSGWMTHTDIIRYEAIGYPLTSKFEHPLPAMVDEERRKDHEKGGRNYESMYGIVITYQPPVAAESKLINSMFETSRDIHESRISLEEQLIKRFDDQINEVVRDLSIIYESLVLRLRQVVINKADGTKRYFDQLVEYLHFCTTGIKQVLALPSDAAVTLDTIIGSQDFIGGTNPKIGTNYIKVVSIEGFPMETWPTILAGLDNLPMQYRWSNRFIHLDPDEGISLLDDFRKKWKQKIRGFMDQYKGTSNGAIDEHAARMSKSAQTAMGDAASGLVRYGHYTSVIVLMSDNQELVEYNAGEVVKVLRSSGFGVRIETVNAIEAYLGSLPGHGYENVRRPVINTINLSHFLPTTAAWQGPEYNPCPFYPPKSPPLMYVKTGSTPFRFTFHVQDVGHAFIGGPNGAGKTTLLNLAAIQHLRYPRAKIRGFEKGMGSFVACHASGGAYYDLGAPGVGFCPLARIDDPVEFAWAQDYIEMCLATVRFTLDAGRRNRLSDGLQILARNDASQRTLTHLVSAIQDNDLREALKPFTLAGGSSLIDSTSDSFHFAQWTMFEIGELFESGPQRLLPAMLYIMRQIERDLDGSPTLIPIDEGWLMLEHPVMQEWLKKWLKTLRKKNAAVVFATQNISDVAKSPIGDVIFTNALTKIFLSDAEALNPEGKKIYLSRGLNERQIELIGRGVPKRDYYYTSPAGKRMFQLGLKPNSLGLLVVGSGAKEDIAKATSLMQLHGKFWFVHFLRDAGLHNEAAELQRRLESI